MGVLEGAVIKVKTVNINTDPFLHWRCLIHDDPLLGKKNARHTARRGQASIVLAGNTYNIRYFWRKSQAKKYKCFLLLFTSKNP